MKKIVIIGAWIIGLIGLLVLLGFVEARHKTMTCCRFNVHVDFNDADPLVNTGNLKSWIIKSSDSIKGKQIEMINVEEIKAMVMQNPYVQKANVYTDIEGDFNVKIWQRVPIIRIIDHQNKSYYIDTDGFLIPTTYGYSSRVRVANGFIRDKQIQAARLPVDIDTLPPSSTYRKLLLMARYLNNDEFMNAQIDQIYVNEDYEFELIPKMGKHSILFGDIEDMEEKFNKLEAFYRGGIKQSGWDKYDKINLKFKDQIVCSKR